MVLARFVSYRKVGEHKDSLMELLRSGRKQVELTVHLFPPKGGLRPGVVGCLMWIVLRGGHTQGIGKMEACLDTN